MKPWWTVAGKATGRLVEVKRLDDGSLRHESGPVIAVVRHASGDEEVGASQADLRGVVLCHGLPHLSHLGKTPAESIASLFCLARISFTVEQSIHKYTSCWV